MTTGGFMNVESMAIIGLVNHYLDFLRVAVSHRYYCIREPIVQTMKS